MTWLRRHRTELVTVTATSIAAVGVLRLVDTQVYNEPGAIDPWLYTALTTNFGPIYSWFSSTYYAARLPQIVPGVFLNSFLSPSQAYVVLHFAMWLSGAILLYLLFRSLYGARISTLLYPVILTNAAYVDAHTWDYFDGFVITYLSGGLYFLVSSRHDRSRTRLALAGFFFAAAATTNLFATLLVCGAIAAYLAMRLLLEGRRVAPRHIPMDAIWFGLGIVTLLGACGAFARWHGGRTLYFMNSIEVLDDIDTRDYKLSSFDWMGSEPQLLVLPFVAVVALLAWPYKSSTRRDAGGLVLTVVGLAILVVLAIWEFTGPGTFLQVHYYFRTVYPFIFLGLAAAMFGILHPTILTLKVPLPVLAVLGLVAGSAPVIVVYGFDHAGLSGRTGFVVTTLLLLATLLAASVLRLRPAHAVAVAIAPVAAALAIGGTNYASAASSTTFTNFETRDRSLAEAHQVFLIGMELIDFMRTNDLERSLPGFWYDKRADPALTGLQSLYYYGYTYVGLEMPVIDDAFTKSMEAMRPENVVLLCTEPTCRDGAAAMRRAGYRIRRLAAARLHSGRKSVWVRAYHVL